MKRLQTSSRPHQSSDVIQFIDTSSSKPHKKGQKPPWRLRTPHQKALVAAAMATSLLLLLLRKSHHCYNLRPTQRLILTASHLRSSDGELRLRIISHNLKLLYDEASNNNNNEPPLKSIVIFSHDGNPSTLSTIQQWKTQQHAHVDEIKLVPNDAINVDVSKWMTVLKDTHNSKVMLLNDSFLLLRSIPELWQCNGVCGLAWTASASDPTRHFQSYIRVLTACEVSNYQAFYHRHSHANNVQELIQSLEVNLSWASNANALYEYEGGHPDEDAMQRRLLPMGYPALKLKKFFETKDPWLMLKEKGDSSRLSPSFDLEVYKTKNHDLNHLSEMELENHFATLGWRENRVYSKLPLVMKGWLKEELSKPVYKDVRDILEDYLLALNGGSEK